MRSLMAAGVLDELELLVAPVALGAGTQLLGPDAPVTPLRLIESETWPGGVVRVRYMVADLE
jgi:riboflavin biosynthesis pyrimidine reductase